MHLTDLLKCCGDLIEIDGEVNLEITQVTADSRLVKPGALFVAIAGADQDGAQYIPAAIENGAIAVLSEKRTTKVVSISSDIVRLAYAKICAAFYGKQPKHVVAVTGTNGKTSVAEFYRQIWALAGEEAASIGTMGLTRTDGSLDENWNSSNTSPLAEITHAALARLAEEKVRHVAIEASSHGLDQYRLHGARFSATAFTNLTQDHLDYHGTMNAYFEAKTKLFTDFEAPALINADDVYGQKLLARLPEAKSYGEQGEWLRLISASPTACGLTFKLGYEGQEQSFDVPLYGAFQLHNIMAASGLALLTGMCWERLCEVIPKLFGVRGRMEKVGEHPSGAPIFIDYAHTPDALKHLLISLRAHTAEKLHVVFGCGGDRDTTKRAPMGAIAAEYADRVIVTDDNPRSEDPEDIRRQIIEAAPGAIEIADRERAIQQAITSLGAGDVLVVAGKGHETYQIIGEKGYEFNDAHKIKEALGAL